MLEWKAGCAGRCMSGLGRRGRETVNRALSLTPLWTDEGWMYLAMVLDLFSRRVIGWSLSHRMTAHLACDAMQMAISNRGNTDGTIMHTDRGSQYCSKKFQRLLKANGIRSSMSKKGDCYDNACAESFFHSLKGSHSRRNHRNQR